MTDIEIVESGWDETGLGFETSGARGGEEEQEPIGRGAHRAARGDDDEPDSDEPDDEVDDDDDEDGGDDDDEHDKSQTLDPKQQAPSSGAKRTARQPSATVERPNKMLGTELR